MQRSSSACVAWVASRRFFIPVRNQASFPTKMNLAIPSYPLGASTLAWNSSQPACAETMPFLTTEICQCYRTNRAHGEGAFTCCGISEVSRTAIRCHKRIRSCKKRGTEWNLKQPFRNSCLFFHAMFFLIIQKWIFVRFQEWDQRTMFAAHHCVLAFHKIRSGQLR